MPKKCIICSAEAKYMIKDSADYYCEECATDYFADLDMLCHVEEEAQKLKKFLNDKVTLDEDGQVIFKHPEEENKDSKNQEDQNENSNDQDSEEESESEEQ